MSYCLVGSVLLIFLVFHVVSFVFLVFLLYVVPNFDLVSELTILEYPLLFSLTFIWYPNDVQNTTQKIKDWATRTPMKTKGEWEAVDCYFHAFLQYFVYCFFLFQTCTWQQNSDIILSNVYYFRHALGNNILTLFCRLLFLQGIHLANKC